MSKASKDYQKIIAELVCLKAECTITDSGMAALQEAIDIISDYEKVVSESNRMIRHYETKDKPVNRGSGIWCCPECGRRVNYNHSHCHWCGKRIGWGK